MNFMKTSNKYNIIIPFIERADIIQLQQILGSIWKSNIINLKELIGDKVFKNKTEAQ